MTAPTAQADPFRGANLANWPGRPRIDAPGLERPAAHCATIVTTDKLGERAVLILASESGEQITTAQLVALAGHLEACLGDETPEGSRAWLRGQLADARADADRYANAITTLEPERDQARLEAARLRRELEAVGAASARLRAEFEDRASRGQAQVDRLVESKGDLRAILEQVRHERDTARTELEAARERADHERDARRAVQYGLDVARDQQAQARVRAADLQYQWQYRRLRAAALAAAGGALAAAAARRHH